MVALNRGSNLRATKFPKTRPRRQLLFWVLFLVSVQIWHNSSGTKYTTHAFWNLKGKRINWKPLGKQKNRIKNKQPSPVSQNKNKAANAAKDTYNLDAIKPLLTQIKDSITHIKDSTTKIKDSLAVHPNQPDWDKLIEALKKPAEQVRKDISETIDLTRYFRQIVPYLGVIVLIFLALFTCSVVLSCIYGRRKPDTRDRRVHDFYFQKQADGNDRNCAASL